MDIPHSKRIALNVERRTAPNLFEFLNNSNAGSLASEIKTLSIVADLFLDPCSIQALRIDLTAMSEHSESLPERLRVQVYWQHCFLKDETRAFFYSMPVSRRALVLVAYFDAAACMLARGGMPGHRLPVSAVYDDHQPPSNVHFTSVGEPRDAGLKRERPPQSTTPGDAKPQDVVDISEESDHITNEGLEALGRIQL